MTARPLLACAALLAACATTPSEHAPDEYLGACADADRAFATANGFFYDSVLGLQLTSADAYVWMEKKLLPEQRDRLRELADEGVEHAERAVALDPRGVTGRALHALNLALSGVARGKTGSLLARIPARVRTSYEAALAVQPGFRAGILLRLKGRFLSLAPWPFRDRAEALRTLEAATAIAPTSQAFLFLGDLHHLEGRREEAIVNWRRAVDARSHRTTKATDPAVRELARRRIAISEP